MPTDGKPQGQTCPKCGCTVLDIVPLTYWRDLVPDHLAPADMARVCTKCKYPFNDGENGPPWWFEVGLPHD
jgi:hypothetical protein